MMSDHRDEAFRECYGRSLEGGQGGRLNVHDEAGHRAVTPIGGTLLCVVPVHWQRPGKQLGRGEHSRLVGGTIQIRQCRVDHPLQVTVYPNIPAGRGLLQHKSQQHHVQYGDQTCAGERLTITAFCAEVGGILVQRNDCARHEHGKRCMTYSPSSSSSGGPHERGSSDAASSRGG